MGQRYSEVWRPWSYKYIHRYMVYFSSCSSTQMQMKGCRQVCNSADMSFLFSACGMFGFFPQDFYFFPCSSWVNVFLGGFFFCLTVLFVFICKNSFHNYFLRSLTCPWVILSVYFCLCFRLIVIMYLESFCICGMGGCSLQDAVFLRLLGTCCCSFPLPLKWNSAFYKMCSPSYIFLSPFFWKGKQDFGSLHVGI